MFVLQHEIDKSPFLRSKSKYNWVLLLPSCLALVMSALFAARISVLRSCNKSARRSIIRCLSAGASVCKSRLASLAVEIK